jgi:hypothetical protein
MPFETAKESLRKDIQVILHHKDTITGYDHLLYNLSKSLFDFVEAVEVEVTDVRARLKECGSRLPPR